MRTRILLALLGTSALVACSSSDASPGEAAATADAAPPGTSPGTSDGAGPGAGDGGAPDGGGKLPAKNLALSGVSFRNVGRKGDALRIGIKGADTHMETSAAIVRVVDADGAPVVAFDTNWDGVADAPERRFHFDSSAMGQPTFVASITIPDVFGRAPSIAKVIVTLEDEVGGHSAPITQALSKQVLRGPFEACDPAKISDRCPAGMACSGAPSTCHDGVAPDLQRYAYFGGSSPRMLFRGAEPDEDIDHISIEFLDANGASIAANLGTDEDPQMSTGITLDAMGAGSDATFFLSSMPIASFAVQVPKIAARVTDLAGNSSARVVFDATAVPVRSAGQACDWNGFDACSSGNVCAPGLAEAANKCASATTERRTKCSAAAELDPAKGKTKAFGSTSGASLWDAPIGCVSNDATGRPESVVRLHLAAALPSLVITTAVPETDFDTAVYLVPGCPDSASAALGCNDDLVGTSSTLRLQNVAAGDYTIVVESVHMRGGQFGVAISSK